MKKIQLKPETKVWLIKWTKVSGSLLVGLSSILAAWFSYDALIYSQQGLNLQKNQILKESLPFFKYRYSEENKAFVVEADSDVIIHAIQWFLPNSVKTFNGFTKYSSSLTIDEIISKIWNILSERRILILPPDLDANTAGYIRCNILAMFDEYNSAVETSTGFPLGVLIEYTRKGGNKSYFGDIVLVKNFEDVIPQIQIVKTNFTENDLKVYMKKGVEQFDKILPIYPYTQNEVYVDSTGRCGRRSEAYKTYFFNEADFKANKEEMQKLMDSLQK